MTKFAMSMVVAAALMGAAVASPHPECEPCAAVEPANLEALTNNGKVGGVNDLLQFFVRVVDVLSTARRRAVPGSDGNDDEACQNLNYEPTLWNCTSDQTCCANGEGL